MNHFKKLSHFIIYFVCIFFIPLHLLATTIIDIDNFSFPKTQVKGVRVTRFDPFAQEFTGLDYFVQPSAAPFTRNFMGLAIDGNCNVTIPVTFKLKNYIIRTSGDIKQENLDDAQPVAWKYWEIDDYKANGEEMTRTVLSFNDIAIQPGSAIMKRLNAKSKKTKPGDDFSATIHRTHATETCLFNNLTGDETNNKVERGVLGELATQLTMMRFGYSGRFSKYGTNHGFDGVFADDFSDDPDLFLTESKNKGRADGVPTIMRDELSEAKIATKLKQISDGENKSLSDDARELLVATGKEIQGFIDKEPTKIYKLAHRVKPDGTCQCLVEPFDIKQYNATKTQVLSQKSPEKDKTEAVKSLLGQVCKTEQEKATIAMGALGGTPREKLILFLNAFGVDAQQQEDFLEGLTLKGEKAQMKLKFDTEEDESTKAA
jgi:hypothetical protein